MANDLERSMTALRGWSRVGGSPYHVKGVAYRGHLAYAAKFVPGGNDAILAALPDHPGLAPFFAQPFLAASRYDVVPLALAGIGAAAVTGLSMHQFVRIRSEWQAREDVGGIYRGLLTLASAEQVALRLPKLMAQYFDFAPVETELVGEGCVRAVSRAVPLPLLAWLNAVFVGYLSEVLRAMRAQKGTISYVSGTPVASLDGIEQLDTVIEIRWRV